MTTKAKSRIKKGDKVKIIVGKDKGKIGKVLEVFNKSKRILVDNVNIVKKHTRPSASNRQGGIVESPAPLHWSNVLMVCGSCLKPARIQYGKLEDGKKIRICSKCKEIIDA